MVKSLLNNKLQLAVLIAALLALTVGAAWWWLVGPSFAATSYTTAKSSVTEVTDSDGTTTQYTWDDIDEASTINLSSIVQFSSPDSVNTSESGDLQYKKSVTRYDYDSDTGEVTETDLSWIIEAAIPTGTTSKTSVDGEITLTWKEVGYDKDGVAVNMIMTITDVVIAPYDSYSSTHYVSVAYCLGSTVSVGLRYYSSNGEYMVAGEGSSFAVYIDFVKSTNTSTEASGTFFMAFRDLDMTSESIHLANSTGVFKSGEVYISEDSSIEYSGTDGTYTGGNTIDQDASEDTELVALATNGNVKFTYSGGPYSAVSLFRRFYSTVSVTCGNYVAAGSHDYGEDVDYTVYWKNTFTKTFSADIDNGRVISSLLVKLNGASSWSEVTAAAGEDSYTYTSGVITSNSSIKVTSELTTITVRLLVSTNSTMGNGTISATYNGTTYSITYKDGVATSYSPASAYGETSAEQGYVAFEITYGESVTFTMTAGNSYYCYQYCYRKTGSSDDWTTKTISSGDTTYSGTVSSIKKNTTIMARFLGKTYTIKFQGRWTYSYTNIGTIYGTAPTLEWSVGDTETTLIDGSDYFYCLGYVWTHWSGNSQKFYAGDSVADVVATLLESYGYDDDDYETLFGNDDAITLNGNWSKVDTTISSTEFYVYLRAGEMVSLELPAGTVYTVEEVKNQYGTVYTATSLPTTSDGSYTIISDGSEIDITGSSSWHLIGDTQVTGTIVPLATQLAEFTNSTYGIDYTQFTPRVTKTLDGVSTTSSDFSFTISKASSNTDDNYTGYGSVALDESGTATFTTRVWYTDEITENTYFGYTITEDIPDDATNPNVNSGNTTYANATSTQKHIPGWTYDGIVYDTTTIQVLVRVYITSSGSLMNTGGYRIENDDGTVTRYYYRYVRYSETGSISSYEYTSSPVFENETATGTLTIKKVVENTDATNKTFSFTVTWTDGSDADTVKLTNGGSWTSDEHKIGTGYTVSEVTLPTGYSLVCMTGGSASITASAQQQSLTGVIVEDSTSDLAVVTVTNTYDAEGVIKLEAAKTLLPEGTDLESGEFTFVLSYYGSDGWETVETVKNDGSAVTFSDYKVYATGTYKFRIAEYVPTEGGTGYDDTITYDETLYYALAKVSDNGDSTLSSTVTYYTDEDCTTELSATSVPTFVNEKTPGELIISKEVIDEVTEATEVDGTSYGNEETLFSFEVAFTAASGDALTGTLTYCIYETDQGSDGATKQTLTLTDGVATIQLTEGQSCLITGIPAGTEWTVTETGAELDGEDVTDCYEVVWPTDGEASGTIRSNETSEAEFENDYSASGEWTPVAEKLLKGGVDIEEGDFTFTLTDEDGNVLETVSVSDGEWEGTTLSTEEAVEEGSAIRYDGTATADVIFSYVLEFDESDHGNSYTFTITEDSTSDDYETLVGTITVTFTVWDDGHGNMVVVDETYSNDGEFVNFYVAGFKIPVTGGAGIAVGVAAGAVVIGASAAVIRRRRGHAGGQHAL